MGNKKGSNTNYYIEVCSRVTNYSSSELASVYHELVVKGYQVELRLDCLVIVEPALSETFEEAADSLLEEIKIDCHDFNVDEVFYVTESKKWEVQ